MKTILFLTIAIAVFGAERAVDPTFYRASLSDAAAAAGPLTAAGCEVAPLFGEGSERKAAMKGLARFTHIRVKAGAKCASHAYAGEEQTWFVIRGEGTLNGKKLVKEDFLYLPVGMTVELSAGTAGLEVVQLGYRVGSGKSGAAELQIANAGDVKKQQVGNHPASTLYQLLIGDTKSTRDRIAAGAVVTSVYIMDMAPGGTNFPHHHDTEEELYLLLDGNGDMVAGGGVDGVEGKHAAKAGDAYFYRLNATVGFYNTGKGQARILAARWMYPFGRRAQ